jgi:hypothetical protein
MPPPPARPKTGLAVASLVIGVASLVAGFSFVLFPLAFIAGVVGVIIGIVALSRARVAAGSSRNQAVAGIVCSGLAVAIALVFTVRVGTWAARNTDVFTRFDQCIVKANDRTAVSACIAGFANDVRP